MNYCPDKLFQITYNIKVENSSSGSAFTFESNGERFLITARHVVDSPSKRVEVETERGFELVEYSRCIYPSNREVDLVAIKVENSKDLDLNFHPKFLKYSSHGLGLGFETFFLGYPYGLRNASFRGKNRSFGLVKKAINSGVSYDSSGNAIGFLLDGHNNPGFSGGPCCCFIENKWHLIGGISSYVVQQDSLFDERGTLRMIINENSGIIHCHNIKHLLDELKK